MTLRSDMNSCGICDACFALDILYTALYVTLLQSLYYIAFGVSKHEYINLPKATYQKPLNSAFYADFRGFNLIMSLLIFYSSLSPYKNTHLIPIGATNTDRIPTA